MLSLPNELTVCILDAVFDKDAATPIGTAPDELGMNSSTIHQRFVRQW